MGNTVRYDELKIGDVVKFHGARVRIINLKRKLYHGETFANKTKYHIDFEIEPADDEAEKILGGYYSHGWYGGVGCLELSK